MIIPSQVKLKIPEVSKGLAIVENQIFGKICDNSLAGETQNPRSLRGLGCC
jgi:hypothetical protein